MEAGTGPSREKSLALVGRLCMVRFLDSDDHEEDNDRGEGTSSSSTVCSNCEQLQMQFKEELAFNSATHEKVVLALEKKIVEEGEKC